MDTREYQAIIKWAGEIAEFRDDTTGRHIEHIGRYLSLLITTANEKGIYQETIATWDINSVVAASALHDIGKIQIPDAILLKSGRLTRLEFETMKGHCLYGKQLIERLETRIPAQSFIHHAKQMAYYHHEKWDGTGYPEGLKGEKTPLNARMMALVDVYDALICERPYKPSYPHDHAIKLIKESRGTHFDPVLADLFVGLSKEIAKIGSD